MPLTRVATAFATGSKLLMDAGHVIQVELSQPGFIRATVSRAADAARIDWAHDSAWRFMPPVRDELGGYLLHDVDLAINKTLALAGREEPRDFIDIHPVFPRAHACFGVTGRLPSSRVAAHPESTAE